MMSRPSVIPLQLENVPQELRELHQWIVWKHHFHKARQKWIKLPMCPTTGKAASTSDAATWATFDAALLAYEFGGYDGLGFVFAAGSGLVGIDIDKCVNGELSPLAQELLAAAPGYVERSPSGTGLHIITRADLGRAYKNDNIGLELYTSGRYFTITGVPL
jgi:putative DNA primase/helicase